MLNRSASLAISLSVLKALPGKLDTQYSLFLGMAGFQQVNGRCEACPEGRFKPEKGNSSCSKCPTNTTTLMDGAKNNKTECVRKSLSINAPVHKPIRKVRHNSKIESSLGCT